MAAFDKYLNIKFLKTLEPLTSLGADKLNEIANKSTVESLPAGRTLFRQGEKDKRSIYVLSGQVELNVAGSSKPEVIKAKTFEAKYPVAQQYPRPSTAKTRTITEVLYVDSDLLEVLLESDDNPSGNYQVTEINVEDDNNGWMLKFLQSRAFLQIPTENIQKILMCMEEVPAKKGEVIIKQGQNNDYYYIVKKGKCSVSRQPSPKAEDIQIAILGTGDGFGEEALITDGKRNATVTMSEQGILMRLSKENFISLLVSPLLDYISLDELKSRAASGDMLLDARQHKEFMKYHLDGSLNIPLSMVRLKLNSFDEDRRVIVYCDDGTRSTATAFLLIQHGLTCSILKDGLPESVVQTQNKSAQSTRSGTSMADIIANLESVTSKTEKIEAKASPHAEPKAKPETKKPTTGHVPKQKQPAIAISNHQVNEVKQKLDNLSKQHQKSEQARKQAEQEIERLKNIELKKQQHALKLTEQKLAAEAKRNRLTAKEKEQAKKEAALLKEKIKTTRQQADLEIKKYKHIVEQQEQQQKELEASHNLLEQQAQKIALEARQQVEREAGKIRLEADKELSKLRSELLQTRQETETRIKQLKDEEQHKAQEEIRNRQIQANDAIKQSIEQARLQAAKEAETIRKKALQEAQALQAEIDAKRQELETETANLRDEALRGREQTLEEARIQAQQLIQKTAEEAQKLDQKRQQIEIEVSEMRNAAEKQKLKTIATARKHAQDIIQKSSAEVKRYALEEVEQIRHQTVEEARTLNLELEKKRQLLEKQARKQKQQMLSTLEITQKQAEEIRLQAEKEAESIRQKALQEAKKLTKEKPSVAAHTHNSENAINDSDRSFNDITIPGAIFNTRSDEHTIGELDAKHLAQEIVSRLEAAESDRLKAKQQARQQNSGLALSQATLIKSKGRTILEGEEDIFIFKEPGAVAKKEHAELESVLDDYGVANRQSEKQFIEKDDFPDFTIEEPDFDLVDNLSGASNNSDEPVSEFSDFELHEPITNTTRAVSKLPNQRMLAVAAALVVTIGIGITFFGFKSNPAPNTNSQQISKQTTTDNQFNATRVSGIGSDKMAVEKELINEAENEFSKLVSKWKAHKQNPKQEILSTAIPDTPENP